MIEEVRASCAAIADTASHVRIELSALDHIEGGAAPPLDPVTHFVDGSPEDVAAYVLTLDAINFGSGWFHELPAGFGYETVAGGLADAWRRGEQPHLRTIDAQGIGELLQADPSHELIGLFARALNELGEWLGDRTPLEVVRGAGSADALVGQLAALELWADTGFLKRAQIAVSDLVLAGVVDYPDADRLTAFADNALPQVLRAEGALVVTPELAARIERGEELPAGSPEERELRACAVHATELIAARVGMTARELDNVLWNRAQVPGLQPTAHRTRTTYY